MTGAVFLGPQRSPTLDRVVRALHVDGPVATITAGWQEREVDDSELDDQLDGRSVNLRLYERWGNVRERDPEFAAATRRRRDELLELRQTYLIRLRHALAAVRDLAPDVEESPSTSASVTLESGSSSGDVAIERGGGDVATVDVEAVESARHPTPRRRRSSVRAEARTRAIEDVRRIDAEHLARLDQHNAEFIARWAPHERDAIAHHRAEIATTLHQSDALAIAGGHIAVLLGLVHLFTVDPPDRLPIVAWSAGAMALTELVMIYHDRTVHGPSDPELYGRGLGVVKEIVAVPHARTRLMLGDTDRMAVLHARFAPARCVLLDEGARLDVGSYGELPAHAVVVRPDGRIGARIPA